MQIVNQNTEFEMYIAFFLPIFEEQIIAIIN
nr:MAG TPA: hypothetical protein [Caudoviricetes sp.]